MIGRKIMESGSTAIVAFFSTALHQMTPFLIAMILIILADLKFGVKAAHYRGETVRFSGAIRRTLNKVVEYLCWISLAIALDIAFCGFGFPVCAVILGIVFFIELHSCFNNFLEPKGKSLKVNFKDLLGGKLKGISIETKDKDEKTK